VIRPLPAEAERPGPLRNAEQIGRVVRAIFNRNVLRALGLGAIGTVGALLFVIYLGELGYYNLAYAESVVPALLYGFYVTVELVGYIVPLGFVIGLAVGWARTHHSIILRGLGAALSLIHI